MSTKVIYFDMDGTVADLYGTKNWLEDLRNSNPRPYINAQPLVNMARLSEVCQALITNGYQIGVITWLSKDSTPEFDEISAQAKLNWIEQYMPYVSEFHAQSYGIPKQKAVRRANRMILVDDNPEVREMWDTPKMRSSIDATGDIITELWKLLEVVD